MKMLFVLFILSLYLNGYEYEKIKEIEHNFDSLVIKDVKKNKIIFSKDKNQKLSPASLTKIMTSIIAIESGRLNEIVTITKEMKKVEPTILNFKVGEQFYLRELVYASLIKSANDAALAIALYLGDGKKENFIKLMNNKAKKLGMRNTNFTNPSGFDIKENKSSTSDLLKLTEYSIKNKLFNKIVNTEKHVIKSINTNQKYTLSNTNKLLKDDKNIVGVKTGYTKLAGACLVARAKNNDKDFIIVMLNSKNRWVNSKIIVDLLLN